MPRSFDCLAKPYRWLETLSFGPYLWCTRLTYLEALAPARRVLLAGEGDGRFLAELHRRFPEMEIHYLDSSPAMLAQAQARCAQARFHLAALPEATLPEAYFDAIVTHFFLDCFTAQSLPLVIERLAGAAAPKALWIVSDFQATPHRWGRLVVTLLYRCFRLLTGLEAQHLVDYRPYLVAAGFRRVAQRSRLSALLGAELWERGGLVD